MVYEKHRIQVSNLFFGASTLVTVVVKALLELVEFALVLTH